MDMLIFHSQFSIWIRYVYGFFKLSTYFRHGIPVSCNHSKGTASRVIKTLAIPFEIDTSQGIFFSDCVSSQSFKNLSGPVGRNTAQAPGQSKNKRCKTPIRQYHTISAKYRGSAAGACVRSRCFNCAVLPHTTRFQQELRARIFCVRTKWGARQ